MSRRPFLVLLVLLGGGIAAVVFLHRQSEIREELAAVKHSVAALESRVEELERRPTNEQRPAVTASAPVAVGPAAPPTATWLPTALAAPEARDQLRQLVATEMAEERSREKAQRDTMRLERAREKRQQVAADLGLSADETERLEKVVTDAVAARRWLEGMVKSRQREPRELAGEIAALRERTDGELRQLLGDDRHGLFLEMTANDKEALAGGPPWARLTQPNTRPDGGR